MAATLRYLLVPGGGGSGAEHWHHRWADDLPNCDWIHQQDPSDGTRAEWVETIDGKINESSEPVVLIAHSLACVAVAHWSSTHSGPVAAALLVAPADIDDDWAEPDSLYKRFQPIPTQPLRFPSVVVSSSNDPFLSVDRALEFSQTWESGFVGIGEHLHIGSDADLGAWPEGRAVLAELLAQNGLDDP